MRIPKINNKIVKTDIGLVADTGSVIGSLTPRDLEINYNFIKENNKELGTKYCKITLIPDQNVISISQNPFVIPYGSKLSTNENILIATTPTGEILTCVITCNTYYRVVVWEGLTNNEILSSTEIKLTSSKSNINLTFTTSTGEFSQNHLTVLADSTYTVTENEMVITNELGNQTITFIPKTTDTYYIYDTIANWSHSSGVFKSNTIITTDVTKTEQEYSTKLSWGQNNPKVNPEEIHGWDNGGDIEGVSLLADHTYVLHREDSAGTSVSYLGLLNNDGTHTILETFTVLTDNIFIGVSGFYFGDVVNDEEPSNLLCADITEKTTTSINYFFKPGDYILESGNTSIQINVHWRQSCCWCTLRNGSWVRTSIVNSGGNTVDGPDFEPIGSQDTASDDFTWNLDGVIANRPVYMYIGFGTVLGTSTTGHMTNSKAWDWIGDGGCAWSILGTGTNQIYTHYKSGTRRAATYTYWRWVFQRLY